MRAAGTQGSLTGSARAAREGGPWRAVANGFALLSGNHAEQSSEIIVGASGEEEVICRTIGAGSVTKLNCPELVYVDHVAIVVLQGANELAGNGIEGIDGAGVGIVRNEQGVAEFSEILGSDGETPRLIQRRAVGELLQEVAIFIEDVNKTTGSARVGGERDVNEAAEVLNAEGREAGGKSGIGDGFYEFEGGVIDVNFVVGVVRSKENISGRPWRR